MAHNRNPSESRKSLLGGDGDEGVLGTALTVGRPLLLCVDIDNSSRLVKLKRLGGKLQPRQPI